MPDQIHRNAIRTMSDVAALEQSPWEASIPARNTYDLLCQACDRNPDRTALRFVMSGDIDAPAFTVDYATLKRRVTQAANAFYRAGITAGKAVTLLLPNMPETHFALLGAQAAGIVSPINPMLEVEYIASIVDETAAEVLVAFAPAPESDIWDKAVEVADRCPTVRTIFVVGIESYLDAAHRTGVRMLYDKGRKPARREVSVIRFEDALDAEPGERLVSGRTIAESDLCSFFHTGGTTGLPKVATHSHLNEAFLAWTLDSLMLRESVILCGLPLFHVNGAMVTGLAAFHSGSEVVMLTPAGYRGRNVMQNFWKLVERFKAATFSGVPTIYSALAALPPDGADISSLRYAICGAAPLPHEVARRFEEASGIRLYEGYGLTEGACVSACNPPLGEPRLGTVGLRLPHQQMKAWKIDGTGNAVSECAEGEIGVIGICGPNVFPGYLREADNKGIWLKPGWLNTGDLGCFDKDGYLRLTGRAKELIIRGGHNIDPAMIEDALLKLPEVGTAAAVGQPDAHSGELPVAYVTLNPGSTITSQELLMQVRELIPERAAIPVRIEILDQMALTAVGKVAKATLRARAAEHVFRETLAAADIEATVQLCLDIRRGTVARVECRHANKEKVRDLLGRFAIPVDVYSSSAPG